VELPLLPVALEGVVLVDDPELPLAEDSLEVESRRQRGGNRPCWRGACRTCC
jgi:hypothetical protein